jgi:hypothetical protein
MARFYIDIQEGDNVIRDDEGIEANSPLAARAEALSMLSDIVGEVPPGVDQRVFAASVRDEANHPVLQATLALNVDWTRRT